MRIIIKKNKQTHKIEKRAFTMYWRNFSSDPYSHHTLLLPRLVKTDFNQFNQAESSIKPTDKQLRLLSFSLYHSYKNDV